LDGVCNMTIHTDRITLVFPIAAKNRAAAASMQTLEITDSGREFESVVPLDVSAVGDYAEQFSLGLIAERDSLVSQVAELTAEVSRLTALIPAPVADYMITPSVFVERLEAASPGVIDRLWSSDAKEAGRLAVTLFTWSERIDCRPGGRLEGYLNLIVQMGFMDAEDVQKVWV
jgi:hypothetical protein